MSNQLETVLKPESDLELVTQFIQWARPIAFAQSKPAYQLGALQQQLPPTSHYCLDCAMKIARRVSNALELGYCYACRSQPKMAWALWITRKNWMGLNAKTHRTVCKTSPRLSDPRGLKFCQDCDHLLVSYADPNVNQFTWDHFEGMVGVPNEFTFKEIAYLYYLLNDITCQDRDHATCHRAANLLKGLGWNE